ncbi:MAG TPA: hypothetical protein VKR05_00615, partial [Candidatus Cybelea sp.]|nr:hypothetical protein [Candidatus Cybelea sp.]
GTPQMSAYVNGIALGSDGVLNVADFANGVLDRFDPVTAKTIAQIVLPQQRALGNHASVQPRFVDVAGSHVLISLFGTSTATTGTGAIDSYANGGRISPVPLTSVPAGSIPDSLSSAGSSTYYADIFAHAVGWIDWTTGKSRLIPVEAQVTNAPYSPNGILAAGDGTAWFTCKDGTTPLQPLCVGHTTYLSKWSVFPGPAFQIGAGVRLSQIAGIMENPQADSGPFTARVDKPHVCTASKVADHNFVVTGKSGGYCTVTVTDAHRRSVSVLVTVIAPH